MVNNSEKNLNQVFVSTIAQRPPCSFNKFGRRLGVCSWSAYDTVNHETLLKGLRDWVGLSGTALGWFSSNLSNRMCRVSVKNHTSSISKLRYGVPQGSILGPILFSIYMLSLGEVIRRHGISFHFYADDSQLYLPIKPNDPYMLYAKCTS